MEEHELDGRRSEWAWDCLRIFLGWEERFLTLERVVAVCFVLSEVSAVKTNLLDEALPRPMGWIERNR